MWSGLKTEGIFTFDHQSFGSKMRMNNFWLGSCHWIHRQLLLEKLKFNSTMPNFAIFSIQKIDESTRPFWNPILDSFQTLYLIYKNVEFSKNSPLNPLSFWSFLSSTIVLFCNLVELFCLTTTFRGLGGTAGFLLIFLWGKVCDLELALNSGFCTVLTESARLNGLGAYSNLEGSTWALFGEL